MPLLFKIIYFSFFLLELLCCLYIYYLLMQNLHYGVQPIPCLPLHMPTVMVKLDPCAHILK